MSCHIPRYNISHVYMWVSKYNVSHVYMWVFRYNVSHNYIYYKKNKKKKAHQAFSYSIFF